MPLRLTAGFRWDAGPDWTVTSDTRFGSYDRYFQYTSVDACAVQTGGQTCIDALVDNDPATIPYITFGGGGPYKQRAWGAQNITSARGTFRVGGLTPRLVGSGKKERGQKERPRSWRGLEGRGRISRWP